MIWKVIAAIVMEMKILVVMEILYFLVPEKLKKLIFEIPNISQTLNMND